LVPCDAGTLPRFQHPDLPTCEAVGSHLCPTRAAHVAGFFHHVLVHTKGIYARKPFTLAPWQRDDIVSPLMSTVEHSAQYQRFVRRYRQAWIEVARKNGKSELLAGLALYLLLCDGEEAAQIYGCARDRDQARLIWDVAARMVQLSPRLSQRRGLRVYRHDKRIYDHRTGSTYTTLARDALGNLGYDPHAVLFDEVIAQPDDALWNAMRTAMGSRVQPLLAAATTAGNDPASFAAAEHSECVRVAESPARAPHRFVYVRNTDVRADPFDEANWPYSNPALGDFLSIEALRDEATEARNDPAKENAFRQFRLNQWVSQATRWMSMHVWRAAAGPVWTQPSPQSLVGREVWVGLDLSAKHDLVSMCVVAPTVDGPADMTWWHWLPEAALPTLDTATSSAASVWVRQGWLTLMDGEVIDYAELCTQIANRLKLMRVREVCYDKWSGEYVRQTLQGLLGRRIPFVANEPTLVGMTVPMRELMALTLTRGIAHHANPVADFCFGAVEVRRAVDNPDLVKPVKPQRGPKEARIDAVVSAALAVGAWQIRGAQPVRGKAVGFS